MRLTGADFAHMSYLGYIMPPIDALPPLDMGALDTTPVPQAAPPTPDGVSEPRRDREASALTDEMEHQAYAIGAIAARYRRAHPVTPPEAFSDLRNVPYGNGAFEAEDLPSAASPLVELIREEMPDAVIASDRGGRMIGLAIYKVWRQRYPNVPFPTIDGKLHFGRNSTSPRTKDTRGVIEYVLNRSGVMAEMAMRRAEGDERPAKVLLLDDWVLSGSTIDRAKKYMEDYLGGENQLAFMLGTMADGLHPSIRPHVVGNTSRYGATWSDKSHKTGVRYTRGPGFRVRDPETGDEDGVWPVVVRSRSAHYLREELEEAVRQQVIPAPTRSMSPVADSVADPNESVTTDGAFSRV